MRVKALGLGAIISVFEVWWKKGLVALESGNRVSSGGLQMRRGRFENRQARGV